jgi:hypothetical protein
VRGAAQEARRVERSACQARAVPPTRTAEGPHHLPCRFARTPRSWTMCFMLSLWLVVGSEAGVPFFSVTCPSRIRPAGSADPASSALLKCSLPSTSYFGCHISSSPLAHARCSAGAAGRPACTYAWLRRLFEATRLARKYPLRIVIRPLLFVCDCASG